MYRKIKYLLNTSFKTNQELTVEQKHFIQNNIVEKVGKMYSETFFHRVLTNEKWTQAYEQVLSFPEKVQGQGPEGQRIDPEGQCIRRAKVYLKAVAPPMSSAEPRNREIQEGVPLRVPNFFEHKFEPCEDSFLARNKSIETRSGTLVEFDQEDEEKRQSVNRELVRQVLEYHAKEYIKRNPEAEIVDGCINIDFAEIRFFTPDLLRDWGHARGLVSNCDNEAMLYRETVKAYDFFQNNPKMTVTVDGKEYKVRFDIIVLNASCNKIRDKFAINQTAASYLTHNPLEEQMNIEGLAKLERKINALQAAANLTTTEKKFINDGFGEESNQTDIVLQFRLMRELLKEIREMLGINDADKTEKFAYNYYAPAARMQLLLRVLDISTNGGCRSAKDRTTLAIMEYYLLIMLCLESRKLIGYKDLESKEKSIGSNPETCKHHADRYRAEIFAKSGSVDRIPELNLGENLGLNLGGASNPKEHGDKNEEMTSAAFAAAEVYHRPNSGAAKYTSEKLWRNLEPLPRSLTPPRTWSETFKNLLR